MNGQLTSSNWQYTSYPGFQVLNLQYNYSATHNNGQITQMVDGISGETVSYNYDALKRLTSASSTPISGSVPTPWTQTYGYDGFGNMTSKTLNGGANSAPAVDPTTNRLTSGYDANGSMLTGYGLTMTYDERNRVASATPTYSGTEYYGYAPDNKRIYRWNPTTGTEEWTFYGARGERIGTFALNTSGTYYFSAVQENIWFRGKLITKVVSYGGAGAAMVVRDRLGTDRETGARYYPYGDEITSSANDTEKYGTYLRDSFTALDYADQRYYASSYGRFNTADRFAASASADDPGSWNRYAYVEGDPVNSVDPQGTDPISLCNYSVYGCPGTVTLLGNPCLLLSQEIGYTLDCGLATLPVLHQQPNPFPECNPSGGSSGAQDLAFIEANYSSALALSQTSGVNVDWLLGWAAEESGWGTSSQAVNNGNYVNESVPPGGTTGGWVGAVACPTPSNWACFGSFSDSLNSALNTTHGTWSPAGSSGLSVIQGVLSQNPSASVAAVFQAVADAGFDPKGTSTNAGYGTRVQNVTKSVMTRVTCLENNGYLP